MTYGVIQKYSGRAYGRYIDRHQDTKTLTVMIWKASSSNRKKPVTLPTSPLDWKGEQ
jgi:hypothetical protein